MIPVLGVIVRRADSHSVIELVINRGGISEVIPLNLGWARGLTVDLTKMLLGSTISRENAKPNGKHLAGESRTSTPTMMPTQY